MIRWLGIGADRVNDLHAAGHISEHRIASIAAMARQSYRSASMGFRFAAFLAGR